MFVQAACWPSWGPLRVTNTAVIHGFSGHSYIRVVVVVVAVKTIFFTRCYNHPSITIMWTSLTVSLSEFKFSTKYIKSNFPLIFFPIKYFSSNFLEFLIWLFCKDNLTAHAQKECHHQRLFLIGWNQAVTSSPKLSFMFKLLQTNCKNCEKEAAPEGSAAVSFTGALKLKTKSISDTNLKS